MQTNSKSFVYNYDLGGNLLSKVEYAYTIGTLGTPVSTIAYLYENTNWKDLLTEFNGIEIEYDVIGNPLTYDGGTFGWEGRKLTSFNNTDLAISYSYNENGIRTSKTVNGVKTDYRLSGDKVTFEQTGSDTIYYVYDTQSQLVSMIHNGTEYAYLRNAQNDIVGLINSAGTQVVSYTYSTWGEVLTVTGSLASTLGAMNPYRYRGYRYDSETGLYYLQSRYYNPQWGRFLNADSVSSGRSIVGANVFQYCLNNPTTLHDPSGMWPVSLHDIIGTIDKMFGFKSTISKEKILKESKVSCPIGSAFYVYSKTTSRSFGDDKPLNFEISSSEKSISTSVVFNGKDSSVSLSKNSKSSSIGISVGRNSVTVVNEKTQRGFSLSVSHLTQSSSSISYSTTFGVEFDVLNLAFVGVVAFATYASVPYLAVASSAGPVGEFLYQLIK